MIKIYDMIKLNLKDVNFVCVICGRHIVSLWLKLLVIITNSNIDEMILLGQ